MKKINWKCVGPNPWLTKASQYTAAVTDNGVRFTIGNFKARAHEYCRGYNRAVDNANKMLADAKAGVQAAIEAERQDAEARQSCALDHQRARYRKMLDNKQRKFLRLGDRLRRLEERVAGAERKRLAQVQALQEAVSLRDKQIEQMREEQNEKITIKPVFMGVDLAQPARNLTAYGNSVVITQTPEQAEKVRRVAYDDGHKAGYGEGYGEGYEAGRSEGPMNIETVRANARAEGFTDGYASGLKLGETCGLSKAIDAVKKEMNRDA